MPMSNRPVTDPRCDLGPPLLNLPLEVVGMLILLVDMQARDLQKLLFEILRMLHCQADPGHADGRYLNRGKLRRLEAGSMWPYRMTWGHGEWFMRQATGTRHCRICSSGKSTCGRYTAPESSFIRARTLSTRAMRVPPTSAHHPKDTLQKLLMPIGRV